MTETVKLTSPIDGSIYMERPLATDQAINAAIERARGAQAAWAKTPIAERGKHLLAMLEALVAMNDEIAPSVGPCMDGAVGYHDAAEMHALEHAQELVVIAGDIGDAGALSGLAQQFLHHVVVGLRPVPASSEAPAIDDVADQKNRLGLVKPQEVDQELGLGRSRS